MKAIILCAGKGERLKPLTDKLPKPMIPIAGKSPLEYLILLCKKHGINEIAINTSYFPEKIKEYFGNGIKLGVKIRYSFESELLGTSGALNNFRDFLQDDKFFVIYGDALTDIDLNKMMEYHKQKKGIVTLALRKKQKSKKPESMIILDDDLKVNKFIEKPSDELFNKLCKDFYFSNSGIYLCEPEILNFIPEGFSDFAYNLFPKLIEQGKSIFGFMMDEYYFREIGKIEKYNLAREEIESGKIKLNFLNNQIINLSMNKAVFLDKDGTIMENIYETDGRLMSPATLEQIKILDYAKEGIQEIKKQGFKVIIVTNQPGLTFGYINLEKFKEMNDFLKKELNIDEIYYCPHHLSRGKVKECDCRKPKTGLILQAAKDFNLDIKNSYMVGDSLSDIQTGKNAGVKKTFLLGIIREDILAIQHQKNIFPNYTCKNLLEVAEKIKETEQKD